MSLGHLWPLLPSVWIEEGLLWALPGEVMRDLPLACLVRT